MLPAKALLMPEKEAIAQSNPFKHPMSVPLFIAQSPFFSIVF
jgi:hypothetical protein